MEMQHEFHRGVIAPATSGADVNTAINKKSIYLRIRFCKVHMLGREKQCTGEFLFPEFAL